MQPNPSEHSVLIALRELEGLEQQRQTDEAAAVAAQLAAKAHARAEAEARARAEAEARIAAEAARHAAEAAARAHHDREIHQRAAEAEARIRGEQAVRLQLVESEIADQLRATRRRDTVRQRLAAAAVLGVLGLVGALGAMAVTATRTPVAVAVADDAHLAALAEYSDVVDAMRRDVTRMRGENARRGALLDATPLPVPAPIATPTPIARPSKPKPRPTADQDAPKPKPPRVKICQTDDPLAEDCPDDPPKKKK